MSWRFGQGQDGLSLDVEITVGELRQCSAEAINRYGWTCRGGCLRLLIGRNRDRAEQGEEHHAECGHDDAPGAR